jgi:nicotinamidase-related amidase
MDYPMTAITGEDPSLDIARPALLFVDPHTNFLSSEGKLWPMVAEVATLVGTLGNLRAATAAARGAWMLVIIVPHGRLAAFFEATYIPVLAACGDHHLVFPVENWYTRNDYWPTLFVATYPQCGHDP